MASSQSLTAVCEAKLSEAISTKTDHISHEVLKASIRSIKGHLVAEGMKRLNINDDTIDRAANAVIQGLAATLVAATANAGEVHDMRNIHRKRQRVDGDGEEAPRILLNEPAGEVEPFPRNDAYDLVIRNEFDEWVDEEDEGGNDDIPRVDDTYFLGGLAKAPGTTRQSYKLWMLRAILYLRDRVAKRRDFKKAVRFLLSIHPKVQPSTLPPIRKYTNKDGKHKPRPSTLLLLTLEAITSFEKGVGSYWLKEWRKMPFPENDVSIDVQEAIDEFVEKHRVKEGQEVEYLCQCGRAVAPEHTCECFRRASA